MGGYAPYGEVAMERFIHQENLKHLRELLTRTTDDAECQRIVKLIEEEERKEQAKRRPKRADEPVANVDLHQAPMPR